MGPHRCHAPGVSGVSGAITTEATSHLSKGTVIADRFEVVGVRGEGGMGAVYECVDRHIDRRVALIPGAEDLRVAVAVREPSIIAYLVDVFERAWERGRPFENRESSMLKDIAVEQRAMTIRMLIEGHSDPVSAKRLGVSPRTYAGYIADLKTEYEAETRFQLGYTMGEAGVSGHSDADAAVED